MNTVARLSLLMLAAISAVSAQTCHVCGNSRLKIFNTAYHHTLQNDRLGSKRTWSCTELENAGLGGQFNSARCGHAQDIATRFCGCNDLNYVPTVQQTPACTFCPGITSGNQLPNPSKEIDTGGYLGVLECGLLINGGLQGFWPSTTCRTLQNTYAVPDKCCNGISAAPPSGGSGLVFCLSGQNKVKVEGKGPIRMEDLQIGDMVDVGAGKFSRLYSFGHRDTESSTEYLQIYGEALATPLEISKDHMVFVDKKGAVPASMVTVGDNLVLGDGVTPVSKISSVSRIGAYAPFTESGTLVVSEVVASSFISVKEGESSLMIGGMEVASLHWLAYAFEAPHRMICKMSPSFCESETYTPEGISHWVSGPYDASMWLMNQSPVVQGLLSLGVYMMCTTFLLAETVLCKSTLLAIVFVLTLGANQRRRKTIA